MDNILIYILHMKTPLFTGNYNLFNHFFLYYSFIIIPTDITKSRIIIYYDCINALKYMLYLHYSK